MLKILTSIVAESGMCSDTVKRVLSGQARMSSSKRLRLAIYRITGRLLPLPQIAKGPYSNSPIIRGLAAFYDNNKKRHIKFSKKVFSELCVDDNHSFYDYADCACSDISHSVSADCELVL